MFFRTFAFYLALFATLGYLPLYIGERNLAYLTNEFANPRLNYFFELLLSGVCVILSFIAGYIIIVNARTKKAVIEAEENQISYLKKELLRCTTELDTQRQTLAANFHDETGNLLAVIIHQTTLLKLKSGKDLQPIVENILDSSQQLYTSSKDFLWHLNPNTSDPLILFEYLVNFGQAFCNNVDIAFSAERPSMINKHMDKLQKAAALNLVFIFKEAMSNVVKHANAKEMVFKMTQHSNRLILELKDDGIWKQPEQGMLHFGITGIEQRCKRNNFAFQLFHDNLGTKVEISAPLIQNDREDINKTNNAEAINFITDVLNS